MNSEFKGNPHLELFELTKLVEKKITQKGDEYE